MLKSGIGVKRAVRIIGIPMDHGQQLRGVDMGPNAVRYAGLRARLNSLGYAVHDMGNIPVPTLEDVVKNGEDSRLQTVIAACQKAYQLGYEGFTNEEFVLFLGGDHSISIGTVAAAARDEAVGLIWIDAHGDFNTPETSPSGNLHGMPVAVLVGSGPLSLVNLGHSGPKLQPAQVVQLATRDLDPLEGEQLLRSGIRVLTMCDINESGVESVARQTLEHLRQFRRLHVSLDMDSLDPNEAAGVGTPVSGGLTYRQAHELMKILGESGRVGSLDIVEINPILDYQNRTAELAVELTASLLGRQIL